MTAAAGSVRVDGVGIAFGGVRALQGVSLEIPSGAVTGLIGPNGAGKSTLVNCVMGQVRPQAGSITVDGDDVTRLHPDRRVRHGVSRTFQTPRLKRDSSVFENVVIGAYSSSRTGLLGTLLGTPRCRREEREARDHAQHLVERFRLARFRNTLANEIPVWALRTVEIARLMMMRPRYVLLDEPAAGTDDETKELLADVVRDLGASGQGVLLIEHHFGFVSRLSDRIVVLHKGEVLRIGTPAEIAADPLVRDTYLGVTHA